MKVTVIDLLFIRIKSFYYSSCLSGQIFSILLLGKQNQIHRMGPELKERAERLWLKPRTSRNMWTQIYYSYFLVPVPISNSVFCFEKTGPIIRSVLDLIQAYSYKDIKKYMLTHFPLSSPSGQIYMLAGSLYSRRV